MKIKQTIWGLVGLMASVASSLAGPAIQVSINPGLRPPVRNYCPPVVCAPRYFYSPGISYYPWGSSVVMASGPNGGFTNVSPVMNYANSAPVYQVPAPVIPAQPIVVPSSPFVWKH